MRVLNKATDLVKNPYFTPKQMAEPPVSRAMDTLTVVDGAPLEEMARVDSPEMVKAVSIGYIYSRVYGCKYVEGRVDQILRLSIARQGLGRREIVDVIEAGGQLPEGYYTAGGKDTFKALEES